jgi:predicted HTH domain antitoxin
MTTIEEVKRVKQEFEAGVAATLVTQPNITLLRVAEMYGISVRQVRSIAERRGISRTPGRKAGVGNYKKETS